MKPFKSLLDLNVHVVGSSQDVQVAARHEIARRDTEGNDNAFATVNLSQLVRRMEAWERCLPGVEPYYAVKSNSDQGIVLTMAKMGAGFDCSSQAEIAQVLGCNVTPDRVVFAHSAKQASHLRFACQSGVQLTTFDSAEELEKIKLNAPQLKLLLRVGVKNPYTEYPALDKKFGCSVEENTLEARDLLTDAKNLNLDVVGVSFHIGCRSSNADPYVKAITAAKDLFTFGNCIGHKMTTLDIGGGFPGDEDLSMFEEFSGQVRRSIDHSFPDTSKVKVIAEPGRFFAKSPITLYTSITSVKKVPASFISNNKKDKGDGFMYYLNHGAYGYFNESIHVKKMNEPDNIIRKPISGSHSKHGDEADTYISVLWGPTCDSIDVINSCCDLPRMRQGDWLEFDDRGAYTASQSSSFNGFPSPDLLYFCEEEHKSGFFSSRFLLETD